MRSIRAGLVLACACLPLLAGCGSDSSPPFTLSCTVRTIGPNRVQANVTVKNQTSTAAQAIIYGPVLGNLRRIRPASLLPTYVTVKGQQGQGSYIAFVVPRIQPNRPTHVFFNLMRPRQQRSLAVTATTVVQAGDSNPLDNADCVIR